MLRRFGLIIIGLVGVATVVAVGIGASQLVNQRKTIAALNRSVSALKASVASEHTQPAVNTATLKAEMDALLVATFGRNFATPDKLAALVGSTTVAGTMTQAIAGLQSEVKSLSASQSSALTPSAWKADMATLQDQIDILSARIGTSPAFPDVSTLLDRVVKSVNCLRQNAGNAVGETNCQAITHSG